MRYAKRKIKRISISTILIYLIVIAILIDSSTMYRLLVDSPLYNRGFGWPLGLLCLLYVLHSKQIVIGNEIKKRLPVIIVFLSAHALLTRYNVQRYLISFVGVFLVLFIFSYVLVRTGQMRLFLQAFSNIMLILSFISIFFWLFGSIMNVLPGRTMLSYYWADHYRTTYTYWYLYFENPVQNIGHGTICNLGIFAESPGYSGFLTYAMLIELVFRKEYQDKKRKRVSLIRIIIFMITMLTTNSTKGIIAVLIAVSIDYILKDIHNKKQLIIRIVLALMILSFSIAVGYYIIEDKLITNSGIIRLDDLRSGFLAFSEHPFIGVGFENLDAIAEKRLVVRDNNGISMGLTVLLAYGGLWILSFYIGAVVVSYGHAYFKNNKKIWFIIICILLYNLFVSDSAFSDPYIFAIASAYSSPSIYRKGMADTRGIHSYADKY